VTGDSGHHGGSRSQLAAIPRQASLPAEVIPSGEHAERGFEVFQLLAKAQGQAIEPLEE
jgi:hypothetical protein